MHYREAALGVGLMYNPHKGLVVAWIGWPQNKQNAGMELKYFWKYSRQNVMLFVCEERKKKLVHMDFIWS